MKKRTLVCFLIFTLCFFYSSIPNTVLGQEESLAQQVFDKHRETLQREDILTVLPDVLDALKDPAFQQNPQVVALGGLDGALDLVLLNPSLLLVAVPNADPKFIELLQTDEQVRAIFEDPDVRTLLKDPAAIDELAGLLITPEPVTPDLSQLHLNRLHLSQLHLSQLHLSRLHLSRLHLSQLHHPR